MKKKHFWWIGIILVTAGALYGYREFSRTRPGAQEVSAKFRVKAGDLIREFTANEDAANKKYKGLNLVVSVSGKVKSVEKSGDGNLTVVLGEEGDMSSVRAMIDPAYLQLANGISEGQPATLKGYFSGFKADMTGLLGSDVELNACVPVKEK